MNYLVLTAVTTSADAMAEFAADHKINFDYLRDITGPFLKYCLIAVCVLPFILLWIYLEQKADAEKAAGGDKAKAKEIMREQRRKDKPTGARRAAAVVGLIGAVKVILVIAFLPFYIIWAGIRKK